MTPTPGSQTSAAPTSGGGDGQTNDILIRGAEAARAKPIDLVKRTGPTLVEPVGPWADELEEAREAAKRAGFQQGREEGLTSCKQQIATQLEELRATVETTLDEVERQAAETGRQLASQTAALAMEIAEAVLARELRIADDPGAEAIARCLDLTPTNADLQVRLNPDDITRLGDIPGLGERRLTLIPDPELASGDALVTVDDATIDARLSESLRRVGEALR